MSTSTATTPAYRVWFLADGVVTGVNAVAYLALHLVLPGVLGSTSTLYLTAGIVLAVVTVGLLAVARAERRPRALPDVLVAINVIWALGSFVIAIANPFALTPMGIAWVLVQGVIVLGFAVLQLRALAK